MSGSNFVDYIKIFCRSGKTMVGLYPTVAGNWIEEAVNFRLRTPSGRSGFVVEAAGGSEGWAEFQASLRKRTPRVTMGTKTPSVRFVTADGKVMDELIDQFTRDTGIRIEQQRLPWADLYAKLQVAVPAGDVPIEERPAHADKVLVRFELQPVQ